MSVESLPYTVLLLLAQFTAGTVGLVLYTQVRNHPHVFEKERINFDDAEVAEPEVVRRLNVRA